MRSLPKLNSYRAFCLGLLALSGLSLILSSPNAQADPMVSYTALSDAAQKAGRLKRYEKASVITSSVKLGKYLLKFSVPETARAYDVIPVRYSLVRPSGDRRVGVEAVAFEDSKKAGDKALYDLAIPGDVHFKLDYLGYASADWDPSKYYPYNFEGTSPISPFPPFKNRTDLIKSSTVKESNFVWFKFRLTNTGDTILDPEGFGASFCVPTITRLGKDGKEEWTANTGNCMERHLTYLYPGESADFWVNFVPSAYSEIPNGFWRQWQFGLLEGDYRIKFEVQWRFHRKYEWNDNVAWHAGKPVARLDVPIKVTQTGGMTPIVAKYQVLDRKEKMPGFFERFEEFMTSFKLYNATKSRTRDKDVIYLQVAPWTKRVVVKLITTNPKQIAVAKIPIRITDDSLSIKYNPKNVMVVTKKGGKEEPVIAAMLMPAFRIGIQQGPYPERLLRDRLQELKDLGANVVIDTDTNYNFPEVTDPNYKTIEAAEYKFFHDVLVPSVGMKVFGFSIYPPFSRGYYGYGFLDHMLGKSINGDMENWIWDGVDPNNKVLIDRGSPLMPVAIAEFAKYQYKRWGKNWFVTKDGKMPVEVEDTWGRMWENINIRYPQGPKADQLFRDWVKEKYQTIDKVNAAWGSNLSDFSRINPEEDRGEEEGTYMVWKMCFNRNDRVFHEWSPAMEDWDRWRTHQRIAILKAAEKIIKAAIPDAELAIRTEGTSLIYDADPNSDSIHERNAYYDTRRDALMFDIIKQEAGIRFYQNYLTLPLTLEEARDALHQMSLSGFNTMFMPGFVSMRDRLVNPYYGRDNAGHFNLKKPTKMLMVYTLMAAYPWWKTVYEEGGAPAIIYSDYTCDLFATETQKREMKLLRSQFERMQR